MTGEEHRNIVNQIMELLPPESQATGSDLLTQLSNDYNETLTNIDTLTSSNNELLNRNETLRDVNAKLFLQVGATNKALKNDTENIEQPTQTKKPVDFNTLFNEKGELK